MRSLWLIVAFAFCSPVLSSAGASCPEAVSESLLAADRQFAADADADGLAGWMKHFAEDATLLRSNDQQIRGKAELAKFYAAVFTSPDNLPKWAPLHSDCSADATMGFTYGTWLPRKGEGKGGQYITVWRKHPDGGWKVLFDIGNQR